MKKIVSIWVMLILSCVLSGQKLDDVTVYIDAWNVPKSTEIQEMNSYAIDIEMPSIMNVFYEDNPKSYNIAAFDDLQKYYDKDVFWNNLNKSHIFNFRQFYEDEDNPDFKINIKILQSYISVETKKDESKYSSNSDTFIGVIKGINVIQIDFLDKKGLLLYTLTDNYDKELETVATFNNYPILNKETALRLAREKYEKEGLTFFKKNYDDLSMLLSTMSTKIKNDLDIYLIKSSYTFYKLKDNKDYDFSVNNQNVENIITKADRLFHPDDYYGQIYTEAKKSIESWKLEVNKFNKEDKKERKVSWGMLHNIASAYMVLGDYDNALLYINQMKNIDYEKKETLYRESLLLKLKEEGLKDGISPKIIKKDFDKVNREEIKSVSELSKELILNFYFNKLISEFDNGVMPAIYLYNTPLADTDKVKEITENIKTDEQSIQVKYIYRNSKLIELSYIEGQNVYKNVLDYDGKISPVSIDLKCFKPDWNRKIEIDYDRRHEWWLLGTIYDPFYSKIKIRYIYNRKNNSVDVYYMRETTLSNGTISFFIDEKPFSEIKLDTYRRIPLEYGKDRYSISGLLYNDKGLVREFDYPTSNGNRKVTVDYKYDDKGNWIEKVGKIGDKIAFTANRTITY